MKLFAVVVLLTLGACSSQSPSESDVIDAASDAESAVAAKSKDDIVCRRVKDTGTHFSKKICRPRSQMEAMDRAARAETDRQLNRTLPQRN